MRLRVCNYTHVCLPMRQRVCNCTHVCLPMRQRVCNCIHVCLPMRLRVCNYTHVCLPSYTSVSVSIASTGLRVCWPMCTRMPVSVQTQSVSLSCVSVCVARHTTPPLLVAGKCNAYTLRLLLTCVVSNTHTHTHTHHGQQACRGTSYS